MKNLGKLLVIASMGALLSGCLSQIRQTPPTISADSRQDTDTDNAALQIVRGELHDSTVSGDLIGSYRAEGILHLANGAFDDANTQFNKALALDPSEPDLHFLNGLTYELKSIRDGLAANDLARVGYETAFRMDPTNWMAAYRLGHWHLKHENYATARQFLAEAMLLEPGQSYITYDLAVASYYDHDPQTAQALLGQLPDGFDNSPKVIRANAMTYAALGDLQTAEKYSALYSETVGAFRGRKVDRRVSQWSGFHERYGGEARVENANFFGGGSSSLGPLGSGGGSRTVGNETGPALQNMVVIDVIIIRQEETSSSSHGVNLLKSLQVTFSGNLLDWERESSITTKRDQTFKVQLGNGTNGITYSLNIANVTDDYAKIMARPSLAVLDGEPANFFLGSEVTYMVSGDGADSFDKEIGLTLRVTPEIQGDGRVRVAATAEFDEFTGKNTAVGFESQISTLKNKIESTALLGTGETLVLGGGTRTNETDTTDEVPVLGDIPILQYFFSRAERQKSETSLIILLTPRLASTVDELAEVNEILEDAEDESGKPIDQSSMELLKDRFQHWFTPTNNLTKTMLDLSKSEVYREFRRGDLEIIDEDGDGDMDFINESDEASIIDQIVEFIYF
jgi:Tfp pilus assembly protein PilF